MPATKSTHGAPQSAAPATKSAHGGSQSAVPATKSARQETSENSDHNGGGPANTADNRLPPPTMQQPEPLTGHGGAHSAAPLCSLRVVIGWVPYSSNVDWLGAVFCRSGDWLGAVFFTRGFSLGVVFFKRGDCLARQVIHKQFMRAHRRVPTRCVLPWLRSFDVTLMKIPRCKRCLSRSSSLLALCLAWMTYVCMHACMNASMYDVCMDGWKGECMHLCMYLSMYVCMYVCVLVFCLRQKAAVYECVLKIDFWLEVALPAVSQQGLTSLRPPTAPLGQPYCST